MTLCVSVVLCEWIRRGIYMCRCVPRGQKRKFDFHGVEVTGICGCLAYYVGAGIGTIGLLIMQQGFFLPAESYLSSSKNCSCSRRFVLLDFGNKGVNIYLDFF